MLRSNKVKGCFGDGAFLVGGLRDKGSVGGVDRETGTRRTVVAWTVPVEVIETTGGATGQVWVNFLRLEVVAALTVERHWRVTNIKASRLAVRNQEVGTALVDVAPRQTIDGERAGVLLGRLRKYSVRVARVIPLVAAEASGTVASQAAAHRLHTIVCFRKHGGGCWTKSRAPKEFRRWHANLLESARLDREHGREGHAAGAFKLIVVGPRCACRLFANPTGTGACRRRID